MKRAVLALLGAVVLAASVRAEMPVDPQINKTITNMRSLAGAIEAFAADHNGYPNVERFSDLIALLTPKYLASANEPLVDGWGFPFVYRATADGCHYRILSSNADGAFARESLRMSPNAPKSSTFLDKKSDIVYQDNSFVVIPAIRIDAFDLHEQKSFVCPKSGSR